MATLHQSVRRCCGPHGLLPPITGSVHYTQSASHSTSPLTGTAGRTNGQSVMHLQYYAFLGLLICHRLARVWFTAPQSTLATVTIWLATPLVYYMSIQMPFAHANGFFASSCFVWLWWKSTQPNATWRTWALLGASGGLLFLVREQLILLCILPVITVLYQLWQSGRAALSDTVAHTHRSLRTRSTLPRSNAVAAIRRLLGSQRHTCTRS